MLQFPEMTKEELENLNQMVQPIEKFFNEGCMCVGTNLRIVMCERERERKRGGIERGEEERQRDTCMVTENLIGN